MHKALITGSSRGIGKSIKNLFEKRGIFVYSPTRQEMDLCSNESIKDYTDTIKDADILINCAGINDLSSIEEMTENKLLQMIQVNLISQTMLIKQLAPSLNADSIPD